VTLLCHLRHTIWYVSSARCVRVMVKARVEARFRVGARVRARLKPELGLESELD
jgi:hypothetical protein